MTATSRVATTAPANIGGRNKRANAGKTSAEGVAGKADLIYKPTTTAPIPTSGVTTAEINAPCFAALKFLADAIA
jgi:hypothetical protein